MHKKTYLKWVLTREFLLHILRGIDIMENILGDLWMFKLMSIAGAVYLIYFFIKDRRGKKD